VPHSDIGNDPVGAPERAQVFDDVLGIHFILLSMKPTTTPSANAEASVVMGRSEMMSPMRSCS
jgi:hypothetical protein